MQIKEYINKNLPNLNWNILPQIFEENNVELTEEIKAYLKETPWNTNGNILTNWGIDGYSPSEEGEDIPVVKKAYYIVDYGSHYVLDESRSDFDSQQEVYNYCTQNYVVNSENPTRGAVNNFEFYYGNTPVHNYTHVTYNMYSEGLYGYEWYDDGAFSEEEPLVYIITENGVYQYTE